jgi:hypothetical protein
MKKKTQRKSDPKAPPMFPCYFHRAFHHFGHVCPEELALLKRIADEKKTGK